jgi:hypothetical protein
VCFLGIVAARTVTICETASLAISLAPLLIGDIEKLMKNQKKRTRAW